MPSLTSSISPTPAPRTSIHVSDALPPPGVTNLGPMDVKWAVKRLPFIVRERIKASKGEIILAGGYIRSCIANEPVNDIDLITPSKESAKKWVDEIAKVVGKTVYETDNAYSVKVDGLLVQFVHRWVFDDPVKCIESFDFTIAKSAIWFRENFWRGICAHSFYADLAAKRLIYTSPVRNEDAGGSMLRVLKFYQRGYRIPLDSLGAVMARLFNAVDVERLQNVQGAEKEEFVGKILTGLLLEVDPNSIVDERAYMPSTTADVVEE